MIDSLTLSNVGPFSKADLTFGQRFNFITGQSGLGKSFLLDLTWFSMTRQWPAEVNHLLSSGSFARPGDRADKSVIEAQFNVEQNIDKVKATFSTDFESWIIKNTKSAYSGLVLYLMADGSFAVWDSERNRHDKSVPALVFSNKEIFNGLDGAGDAKLCNGLILDWVTWTDSISCQHMSHQMNAVLAALSPQGDSYSAGLPARISIFDSRLIPTITMPYGIQVPVTQASSGIRKIVELAYMLVWAINEHAEIMKLKGARMDTRITLLLDDVETHLHPQWQRSIVPAILNAVNVLFQLCSANVSTQIIMTTHSPIIESSVEEIFDREQDKWFHLDHDVNQVVLS